MAFGTFSYNDYAFGELTHVTAAAENVYDDAGRAVLYVRWKFTASSVVVAQGADIDANDHFLRVRQELERPGQAFEIRDKGFGPDLIVNNGPGTLSDVDFGPKPKILSWTPIGHETSVEFVWEVEVCVPECTGAATTGLMAFNYSINWTINERGFTTRVVSGFLDIAMTRSGVNLPDTADQYLNLVSVDRPDDFKRTWTRDLSSDKKRLNWSITDAQIESREAWPAGVTNIDGQLQIKNSRASRPVIYHTLRVSIELAGNRKSSLAWEIFRAIWGTIIAIPTAANYTILLEDIDMERQIFGLTYDFSVSYRVIVNDSADIIAQMLDRMGFMEQLGYDWPTWAASMTAVNDPRGIAGMEHTASDDVITDLCNPDTPIISSGNSLATLPANTAFTQLCNTKPDPDKSYVYFDAFIEEETQYAKSFAVELGSVNTTYTAFDPADTAANLATIDKGSLEDTVAEAAPSMFWRFRGQAQRMGYPIPSPDLISVDGVTFEKVGTNKFVQKNKGTYYCVDLYEAAWDFMYRVTDRPSVMSEDVLTIDPNYTAS